MVIIIETDSLLSVAQFAKALKRPRLTIYRWIKAEKVQAIKLGGILYIPQSEVERLKDERDSQPLPMP